MSALPTYFVTEARLQEVTQSFTDRGIHVECTRPKALTRSGKDFYREWKVSQDDTLVIFWDVTYFDGNDATVTVGPAQGPGANALGTDVLSTFANAERVCREAGEIS